MFSDGWMNMPQRPHNCPPGLEYLTTVDRLLVKQKVELLEGIYSKNILCNSIFHINNIPKLY